MLGCEPSIVGRKQLQLGLFLRLRRAETGADRGRRRGSGVLFRRLNGRVQ